MTDPFDIFQTVENTLEDFASIDTTQGGTLSQTSIENSDAATDVTDLFGF